MGTLKPQNPHRRRMEFGGEDDVQEALPLEPTVSLHPEDLQGVLNEDQPGPESRYQTLDQTGGIRTTCGTFSAGSSGMSE